MLGCLVVLSDLDDRVIVMMPVCLKVRPRPFALPWKPASEWTFSWLFVIRFWHGNVQSWSIAPEVGRWTVATIWGNHTILVMERLIHHVDDMKNCNSNFIWLNQLQFLKLHRLFVVVPVVHGCVVAVRCTVVVVIMTQMNRLMFALNKDTLSDHSNAFYLCLSHGIPKNKLGSWHLWFDSHTN